LPSIHARHRHGRLGGPVRIGWNDVFAVRSYFFFFFLLYSKHVPQNVSVCCVCVCVWERKRKTLFLFIFLFFSPSSFPPAVRPARLSKIVFEGETPGNIKARQKRRKEEKKVYVHYR
jgi:hypothetical protein